MAGKSRTVYFMEPVLLASDGSPTEIDPGFWESLHDRVGQLTTERRLMTFRQRRYGGSARQDGHEKYLYVGKRRPGSDFPDHAIGDADEVPLMLEGELVEPLYVVPVADTNYAAFMRSSGGPTFEAFERWVNHALELERYGEVFELRPYLRRDAVERLQAAMGVSKLHLKFDPDAFRDEPQDPGQIETALRRLEDIGGGGVSIEVEISFGQATPSELGAERYAEELNRALRVPGLRKAMATLLRPKPGTEASRQRGRLDYTREKIDFVRDRVTHQVEVGESADQRPTPDVVLRAMGLAIEEFRGGLREGWSRDGRDGQDQG